LIHQQRCSNFLLHLSLKIIDKETMKNNKTALVVGANGVIGSQLIAHLEQLADWTIIGLSRRGGQHTSKTTYLSVDLLNAADCKSKLLPLSHVTHIFYAAYQEQPTWAKLVEPNLTMLINVVKTIESVATHLAHVSLMQGYKVYGAHYGPFKTPAKETDGGHMPPEFNVAQQQFLEKQQLGKQWTWSALRPSVVGGTALGNPMNLVLVIAIYATIAKELGLPLRFPGKVGAYDKLMDFTDSLLLAKATVWAATNPQCANQAFNITNGDLIRWNELWPKIANYFDMDVAPPLHLPLQTIMSDKAAIWESIQQKHGLAKHSYEKVSSWAFGDFVFSWDYDFFSDGSKARRLGFHDYVETEKMFFELFDELIRQKVIPGIQQLINSIASH
jgi:nucleoside-diphosphate-sugar epimerase